MKMKKFIHDVLAKSYRIWVRTHYTLTRKKYLPTPVRHDMLASHPLVSVVVPVYNTNKRILKECIESVLAQSYSNFELIMVDDHSIMPETIETLRLYEKKEKVKVSYRGENGGISTATNDALKLAGGDYIAFVDCDDILEKDTLYYMVKKAIEEDCDLVYTDEDKISEHDIYYEGYLTKPEWSPDLLMSCMYTCHLSIYKSSIIKEIGGLRSEYDGAQDYDLALRFTEKTCKIGHVPYVCYHWRKSKSSTSENIKNKPYAIGAGERARKDAVKRRGQQAWFVFNTRLSQTEVYYYPQNGSEINLFVPENDKILKVREYVSLNCREYNVNVVTLKDLKKIADEIRKMDSGIAVVFDTGLYELPNDSKWLIKMAGAAGTDNTAFVSTQVWKGRFIKSCGYSYRDGKYCANDNGRLRPAPMRYLNFNTQLTGEGVFAVKPALLKEIAPDKKDIRDISLKAYKRGLFNVILCVKVMQKNAA